MPPTIDGNFFACVGVLVCVVSFVGVRVFVGLGVSFGVAEGLQKGAAV